MRIADRGIKTVPEGRNSGGNAMPDAVPEPALLSPFQGFEVGPLRRKVPTCPRQGRPASLRRDQLHAGKHGRGGFGMGFPQPDRERPRDLNVAKFADKPASGGAGFTADVEFLNRRFSLQVHIEDALADLQVPGFRGTMVMLASPDTPEAPTQCSPSPEMALEWRRK
jgi:hypothetical protein